jgi:hypothetical protein
MNRISGIALLSFASLATCTGAIGQEHVVRANIPFDFVVGETWMPAGVYTISSSEEFLWLQSADSRKSVAVISTEGYHDSRSGGNLVFDKYNNQYFLRHIVCPTLSSLNRDLPQGKVEKRARSLEANLHGPEKTLVAAR